jgi:hypothetical protein
MNVTGRKGFRSRGGRHDAVGMQHLSSITGDSSTSVSGRAAVRWARHRHWLREVYACRSK